MTETYKTDNKGLVIPDINSKNWGDEIQNAFNDIDAYLKGIGVKSISKNSGDFNSVSVDSSIGMADDAPIRYGTQGQFKLQYNSTAARIELIDTTTPNNEAVLYTGISDDHITFSRTLRKETGVEYVTTADINNGPISPSSITTTHIDSDAYTVNDDPLQAPIDDHITFIAKGMGIDDAIDINATDTPVSDACETLRNNGPSNGVGTIILPPSEITNAGSIRLSSGQSIIGQGQGRHVGDPVSTIHITTPNTNGIECNPLPGDPAGGDRLIGVRLDNFCLKGPGLNTQSGYAISIDTDDTGASLTKSYIGSLKFLYWTDVVFNADDGSGTLVDTKIDQLIIVRCDAAARGLIRIHGSYSCRIDQIVAYPVPDFSGTDSTVLLFDEKGSLDIGVMNLGGSLRYAVVDQRYGGMLTINNIHYEPQIKQISSPMIWLKGNGQAKIGGVHGTRSPVDMGGIYRISDKDGQWGCGNNYLGIWDVKNVTLTNLPVNVQSDTTDPIFFEGPSSDVHVTTAASPLTHPVNCLEGFTQVS